ncbi:MAG: MoaD/ThiS family protein [Dehalococcoidia bacterium]|nr:MoaD/ThiS family protein [Dehalococcoidia bacterium]
MRFTALGLAPPLGQLDLELEEGTTLKEALDFIESRYGPGGLAGILAVNMHVVNQEETARYVLKDGDSIVLAPPLSGG